VFGGASSSFTVSSVRASSLVRHAAGLLFEIFFDFFFMVVRFNIFLVYGSLSKANDNEKAKNM